MGSSDMRAMGRGREGQGGAGRKGSRWVPRANADGLARAQVEAPDSGLQLHGSDRIWPLFIYCTLRLIYRLDQGLMELAS